MPDHLNSGENTWQEDQDPVGHSPFFHWWICSFPICNAPSWHLDLTKLAGFCCCFQVPHTLPSIVSLGILTCKANQPSDACQDHQPLLIIRQSASLVSYPLLTKQIQGNCSKLCMGSSLHKANHHVREEHIWSKLRNREHPMSCYLKEKNLVIVRYI